MSARRIDRPAGPASAWPFLAGPCMVGLCLAGSTLGARAEEIPRPDVEAVNIGGLEARTAALILSGQEAGDLAAAVLALPVPAPDGRSRVTLVVDLGGLSLMEGNPDDRLVTEIYAYALAEGSALRASLTQAFVLDLAVYGPTLREKGIKFLGHLDLPPGEYSLRTLVLNRRSDRLALTVTPLTVPAWGGEGPVLLPLLFPEPAERWLQVWEQGSAAPATLLGAGRLPATRPLLANDAGAPFYLAGASLPASLSARLLDADREEIAEIGLGTLSPLPAPVPGLELRAAELNPTGLPEGGYVLQVSTAADGAGGVAREALSPMVILEGGDHGTLPTWTQLGVQAAVDVLAEALDGGPLLGPSGRDLEQQKQAYRQALQEITNHDRTSVLGAVMRMEREEIGEGTAKQRARLEAGELAVALELAGQHPESLVPLMRLHEQLYRAYHERRKYLHATHSRQLLWRLAEAYVERSSSEEARRLVACTLVSLGGYIHEVGDKAGAQRAFERALDFEPTQEAALLGLASIREYYGDYHQAAALLKTLVKEHPGNPEAVLRLGLNLKRLDQTRKAEELLQAATRASNPRWVRAIAYQELAGLYAADRRLPRAVELLREGIEALPANQRLYIQLAAFLDRQGNPREAHAVLASMPTDGARSRGTPRLRYSQLDTRPLERSRRELARAADERLSRLARVLVPDVAPAGDPTASLETPQSPPGGDLPAPVEPAEATPRLAREHR